MTDALLEQILARIDALEPLHAFPGVDEIRGTADRLAAGHADRITRTVIGTSRLGEEIVDYAVGEGPAILVIGGVHPNEPIGFHTALELLRDLAEGRGPAARIDARWHVVPCIDPDGTRLNEGWFTAPGDRVSYGRDFYRPAPLEQVEWSFPLDHRGIVWDSPIPETAALMSLMDATRPALVVGLHNAELGGVYYYASPDLAEAFPALHAIPAHLGLPLDLGEPEFAGIDPLADAVFPALTARDMIDVLLSEGIDPAPHVTAAGTADHARDLGASAFVAELPYWSHPAADDTTPAGISYADALRRKADALDEVGAVLLAAVETAEPHLVIDSQLRRAAVQFARFLAGAGDEPRHRAGLPASQREATVAEVFSNEDHVRMFQLRFGSMLARTLRAEIAAGTARPAVRAALAELEPHLDAWYAAAHAEQRDLRVIPIERLVGVQLGTMLAAAHSAVARRRESVA
ncbi:M14 family zinc carboxypeptidase [Microbacterium sp. Marseille-Q6965]|uniref:M14 family zinc carboxypeptidase n=1 Tax=Microbacterium sp. Marseille-Q6965 TaxID=2965072 RepID=UPI0021B81544|nr:M14 family zinc carboxypeptidase [Microbacterium sp. Marseille-Q6965]